MAFPALRAPFLVQRPGTFHPAGVSVATAFPNRYALRMAKRRQDPPERVAYSERSTLLWPDPKTGPFWIGLYWASVDGRNECVGVTIFRGAWLDTSGDSPELELLPGEALQALKSTDLRIPLDRLAREHHDWAKDLDGEAGEIARHIRGWSGDLPTVAGWGPNHLADVAQVYREAWQHNQHPTKAVAEHFSVSKSAAAKWVARCRDPKVGLLPPTERGRPRAVAPPPPPKSKTRKAGS